MQQHQCFHQFICSIYLEYEVNLLFKTNFIYLELKINLVIIFCLINLLI